MGIPVKCQPRDFIARYDRTFLTYRGQVKYVRVRDHNGSEFDNAGGYSFDLHDLRDRNEYICVHPYSDDIDSSSVPLGYCTGNKGCVYVARSPVRRWKQGVCEVLIAEQLPEGYMWEQPMIDMLEDIYPSVGSSIERLSLNEMKEIAISKSLKLARPKKSSKGLELYAKENIIGYLPSFDETQFVINGRRTSWAYSPYLDIIDWRVNDDQ